jgi:DMSO/TMAO reductase YedYZ molybdopterin-dependent catalytic subunit
MRARTPRPRAASARPAGGLTRRSLLARSAAAGAGAAAAAAAGAAPAWAGHTPQEPTPDRPPPSSEMYSFDEVRLAFRCHGMHLEALQHPITPLGQHFVLIHFDVPYFAQPADNWTVSIGGRVRTPTTLSLGQLKQRPTVLQPTILECAGIGRSFAHPRAIYVPWFDEPMGVYEYKGTLLRPILQEAGLLDDAVEVVFTGFDEGIDLGVRHHFERALPLKEALADGVLLAWEANGQPLLPHHGFPLRLIVPTWYGMASVKYLTKITVVDHTFQGEEQKLVYRNQFGSSDSGRPIQKKAVRSATMPPGVPDAISRHRYVPRGTTVLQGKAWSGEGRIVRVEVSTDDRRTWQPATLAAPVGGFAWTPWTFAWNVRRRGQYVVSSRATDSAGNIQPLRPFWNQQGMAQNGVERIGVTAE